MGKKTETEGIFSEFNRVMVQNFCTSEFNIKCKIQIANYVLLFQINSTSFLTQKQNQCKCLRVYKKGDNKIWY